MISLFNLESTTSLTLGVIGVALAFLVNLYRNRWKVTESHYQEYIQSVRRIYRQNGDFRQTIKRLSRRTTARIQHLCRLNESKTELLEETTRMLNNATAARDENFSKFSQTLSDLHRVRKLYDNQVLNTDHLNSLLSESEKRIYELETRLKENHESLTALQAMNV